MSKRERDPQRQGDTITIPRQDETTERPRQYKVILHNDDFTTMEFVVDVLVRFFRKAPTEAFKMMLQVHHQGFVVAGTFSRDIAETKAEQVTQHAQQQGHPFLATVEPA